MAAIALSQYRGVERLSFTWLAALKPRALATRKLALDLYESDVAPTD